MKRLFLSSFMLALFWGAMYAFPSYSTNDTHEQLEKDSIEQIVSKIELPVIHINTVDSVEPTCKPIIHPDGCMGQSITDNEYVKGQMTVNKGDSLLYNSGEYKKKESGMRIKVRGNTSADFPYKSFKIKTEVKTDLLNRNEDEFKSKSWVLLNYYTARDLRAVAGFYIAKLLGMEWEPEYQFVNLFINGEYRGLYILAESIKVGDGRCQLDEDTGLLIEADPYWWNEDDDEPVIKTKHLPYSIGYTFKNPELDVNDPMLTEIENYLNAFEDSLFNNKDISRYIDIKSFATWVLAQDILGTWDGAGSNIYVTKYDFLDGEDRFNSKMHMGPLWDLDSAFDTPTKWNGGHISDAFYFPELFKRPEFVNEYYNQWINIHEDVAPKTISFIKDFIAKEGDAIDESRRISPPDSIHWKATMADNLKEIEDWFTERIPWMEEAVHDLFTATSVQHEVPDCNSVITSVEVYDIDGKLYKTINGKYARNIFNTKNYGNDSLHLQPGNYVMHIIYDNGNTVSQKIIIK